MALKLVMRALIVAVSCASRTTVIGERRAGAAERGRDADGPSPSWPAAVRSTWSPGRADRGADQEHRDCRPTEHRLAGRRVDDDRRDGGDERDAGDVRDDGDTAIFALLSLRWSPTMRLVVGVEAAPSRVTSSMTMPEVAAVRTSLLPIQRVTKVGLQRQRLLEGGRVAEGGVGVEDQVVETAAAWW